ncbi:calcium-binding protein [Pontivivens insulae]|uniref:Bifunctional hemolysin/adenylate cyclase n=1 Tax=Pontivivens insulae TaxID=1639689 RepID=A0A2R8AD61_9RHOB|nr:calcium-binding protein [Pontivivens insulae]RED13905.1 Ca2+-binding RTX toxin-like protein [Pontivivens insulae]SPF29978.1 Bifunctional hemolysin/adenylate cyclase [Pontivivens insulae]
MPQDFDPEGHNGGVVSDADIFASVVFTVQDILVDGSEFEVPAGFRVSQLAKGHAIGIAFMAEGGIEVSEVAGYGAGVGATALSGAMRLGASAGAVGIGATSFGVGFVAGMAVDRGVEAYIDNVITPYVDRHAPVSYTDFYDDGSAATVQVNTIGTDFFNGEGALIVQFEYRDYGIDGRSLGRETFRLTVPQSQYDEFMDSQRARAEAASGLAQIVDAIRQIDNGGHDDVLGPPPEIEGIRTVEIAGPEPQPELSLGFNSNPNLFPNHSGVSGESERDHRDANFVIDEAREAMGGSLTREQENYLVSATAGPVIIDLDQDGVNVNFNSDVAFDYDGDGYRELTSWAAADDGFLVIDLDANGDITADGGDGVIDQAKELAFTEWVSGDVTDLQALAEAEDDTGAKIFDTDGNGVLDSNDAVWGSMKVWQDLDQDGEVDNGELKRLADDDANAENDWNITQINLTYDDGSAYAEDDDDVSVLGNTVHGFASYVRDGVVVEGGVGDVTLSYNVHGWRQVETETGYKIELERGEFAEIWEAEGLDNAGAAQIILLGGGEAGGDLIAAYGDDRTNTLDAAGMTKAVILDGAGGDDVLTGGDGDDLLSGGEGADQLHAGAGNDVVFADSADDVAAGNVTGGDGYDRLIMSAGASLILSDVSALGFEAVTAGDEADQLAGLSNDTDYVLYGNGGADTLQTAGGNDILTGDDGDDDLDAGSGADRLFGGSGADTLTAGSGDDYLSGGSGGDLISLGAGNDYLAFGRGQGDDTLVADIEANRGGLDELDLGFGVSLDDVTLTIEGVDAILGVRALDDDETTDVDESVELLDGTLRIQEWDNAQNRIETLSLAGGWMRLDISDIAYAATGFGGDDLLLGTGEFDWLNSGAGDDTVLAGAGDDILLLGAGDDVASAGAGRDYVSAGVGNDLVRAEDGNDTVSGGEGDDTLIGADGHDQLIGGQGADRLQGGLGNDTLYGGSGSDTLEGGVGDDTYHFGRGDGHDLIIEEGNSYSYSQAYTYQSTEWDLVEGDADPEGKDYHYVPRTVYHTAYQTFTVTESGWDTIELGHGITSSDVWLGVDPSGTLTIGLHEMVDDVAVDDVALFSDRLDVQSWTSLQTRVEVLRFSDGFAINLSDAPGVQSGYSSDDTLSGSDGRDVLIGSGGGDMLIGYGGEDVLIGGDGADNLIGWVGDDQLLGGVGDDTLNGGDGDDRLIGGLGNDSMRGHAGADIMSGGAGDDSLMGGRGNDIYLFNRGDGHDVIDEGIFLFDNAPGQTGAYYHSGDSEDYSSSSSGYKGENGSGALTWVNEMRSGATFTIVDGGSDTIQLGQAIELSDLIVSTEYSAENGELSLIVELEPTEADIDPTDSLTVLGWNNLEMRVETLVFNNGFSIDLSQIKGAQTGDGNANTLDGTGWLSGLEGDDVMLGSDETDILLGGSGADTLEGGLGDDYYVYSRGDGHDLIVDAGSSTVGLDQSAPGGDKLVLDFGIDIEDVVFRRVGDDMEIFITSRGDANPILADITDRLTVQDWALATQRIDVMQFSDGLDFDISQIEATHLGADALGATALSDQSDDTLSGTDAAEWYDGFAGDDVIIAFGGADFVFGRQGDDSIASGAGNDAISGGDGNDTIDGGADDDILSAGAGDDQLIGGAGNDMVMAGAGDDLLDGGAGVDILIGGRGQDTITASEGADEIRFDRWDGSDIYQGSVLNAADDVVAFGQSISAEAVKFRMIGDDLRLELAGTTDGITFTDWASGVVVEGIQVEGRLYTAAEINGLLAFDGARLVDIRDGTINVVADASIGHGDYSVTDGLERKHLVLATARSSDAARSEVAGYTRLDWVSGAVQFQLDKFERLEFSDLILKGDLENGLEQYFDLLEDPAGLVEGINKTQIVVSGDAGDHITGANGDDVLAGGRGLDKLTGYAGNDTFVWSTGDADDVIYDGGESLLEQDRLVLTDVTSDQISLSRDVTATFKHHMQLLIEPTGEELTIEYQYWYSTTHGFGLESIEFADGEVWTEADITANTWVNGTDGNDYINSASYLDDNFFGGAGDDTIIASTSDDHLRGGAGSDSLSGSTGSDTYIWGIGDGDDILYDGGASLSELDHLIFTNVTADEVALSRDITGSFKHHMDIEILTSGEKIKVDYQYWYSTTHGFGLESIEFADGEIWSEADITANTWVNGTDGNDYISSSSYLDDNFFGAAGDDTIIASSSNDRLSGGSGDDVLTGGAGADSFEFTSGTDRVTDFAIGTDQLSFTGITFDDLVIGTDSSGHADIDYGAGSVILTGVLASALSEDDFQFV